MAHADGGAVSHAGAVDVAGRIRDNVASQQSEPAERGRRAGIALSRFEGRRPRGPLRRRPMPGGHRLHPVLSPQPRAPRRAAFFL